MAFDLVRGICDLLDDAVVSGLFANDRPDKPQNEGQNVAANRDSLADDLLRHRHAEVHRQMRARLLVDELVFAVHALHEEKIAEDGFSQHQPQVPALSEPIAGVFIGTQFGPDMVPNRLPHLAVDALSARPLKGDHVDGLQSDAFILCRIDPAELLDEDVPCLAVFGVVAFGGKGDTARLLVDDGAEQVLQGGWERPRRVRLVEDQIVGGHRGVQCRDDRIKIASIGLDKRDVHDFPCSTSEVKGKATT